PVARVALGRALLDLDEGDAARDALLGVVDSSDAAPEVRIAAVQALGATDFANDDKVAKALRKQLDGALEPRLKLAAAKSLYRVSPGDKRRCTKEMEQWLRSDRSELRVEGALALAEIGSLDLARPVLDGIRLDPTPEGRLAAAYISV